MKIISIREIDVFEGFSEGSPVCVWVHLQGDAVFGWDTIATDTMGHHS